MAAGKEPRTILVTRTDEGARQGDADLIEAATVEVLRASACAADVVLVPATLEMLPLAAVIAHDLRQGLFVSEGQPRGREGPSRFPARLIPIEWNAPRDNAEFLQPFLRLDLGGDMLDPIDGHEVLPVRVALERYPPGVVVSLTGDDFTVDLLSSYDRTPRVCYFSSLLGGRAASFIRQLRYEAIDLERQTLRLEVRDEESGRSDDEGLEPFIPFGVLLQYELSRRQ